MLKKSLMVLVLILMPMITWAGGNEWKTQVTKPEFQTDVYTTDEVKIIDYGAFGMMYKLLTADTTKTDSMVVTIQTSKDKITWEDIYSFPIFLADTCTKYKFFPLDSMLVYPWETFIRAEIVSVDTNTIDTATSEILRPTGDGTTHDWYYSTGSTYFGVIDEAILDTTDFDSTAAYNKWLVVTCGDHTRNEYVIDSIEVTVRGGCQVDTGYFKFGATLADTETTLRLLSDSTMMEAIDSTTYSVVFATNPYGTSWTLAQIDSLGIILQSLTLNTGAALRGAQGYITVYYDLGRFSPAIVSEIKWILKNKSGVY